MSKALRTLLALLLTLTFVAACGDDDDDGGSDTTAGSEVPEGPAISIAAQDFGESAILAEIYKQALEEEGYEVGVESLGGFRDIELEAFDAGDVNFAPEYAASMLEHLNEQAGEATSDPEETTQRLQTYLDDLELTALEPTAAVDTNAFVVTEETADEFGLQTIGDLADATDLRLGGVADCETNPFCIPALRDTYEADFSNNFTALAAENVAEALASGEIDVAVLFSTSARIADEGWVVLEDEDQILAADNVVPVVKNDVLEAYGTDFEDLVNGIGAALTTEGLLELNKRFDIDAEDADVIAEDWLAENR